MPEKTLSNFNTSSVQILHSMIDIHILDYCSFPLVTVSTGPVGGWNQRTSLYPFHYHSWSSAAYAPRSSVLVCFKLLLKQDPFLPLGH